MVLTAENPRVSTQAISNRSAVQSDNDIVGKITTLIESKQTLQEAAASVLQEARKEGWIEAILDEYGVRMLTDMWRHHQRQARRLVYQGQHQTNPISSTNGRLAALKQSSSYLEAMYDIGEGTWVRLGSMTRSDCNRQVERYRSFMVGNGRNALFFEGLAIGLEKTQTVADKYSEGQVKRIYENAKATDII
jgi:hypothetical protein